MTFRHFIAAVLATLSFAAAAAVDANKASQAELESVKGIGPALSSKIVAARQQSNFKDWGDMLDRVAGLGERNAQKLSSNGLTVAGAGYTASADVAKPARSPRAENERKVEGERKAKTQ